MNPFDNISMVWKMWFTRSTSLLFVVLFYERLQTFLYLCTTSPEKFRPKRAIVRPSGIHLPKSVLLGMDYVF